MRGGVRECERGGRSVRGGVRSVRGGVRECERWG